MSLQDYEKFSSILKSKNINDDNMKKIMEDIKKSKIFEEDKDFEYDYDKWLLLDKQADIIFSNKSRLEKKIELSQINKYKKEKIKEQLESNEKRILQKINEFSLFVYQKPNLSVENKKEVFNGKYGRTPLHEAICSKDLNFVIECKNKKMYLNSVDNSGNTPLECAYYYCFPEAVSILSAFE